MPPSRRQSRRRHARRRSARRALQRLAALAVLTFTLLTTLLLTAFGSGGTNDRAVALRQTTQVLAATGRPQPQIVAIRGSLRLQLPVTQAAVTAIGYHAANDGALPLEPVGRQGNRGFLRRLVERLAGGGESSVTYYRLPGGEGPDTAVLDVGARAGTDVFAPTDGTIVGITDFVLNGRRYGSRIDIQPVAAPALVVSVTRLRADPALMVGDTVLAASSRLGRVLDLSRVEEQALARYAGDAGNHVSLDVRRPPALTLP